MSSQGPSGIPLDEYTSTIPPGWKPGMEHYPLRMYIDKMQMWWKQTDFEYAQASVLIAGRLKLGANKLALKLRLERPLSDQPPMYDIGADAIVRQRVPEIRDSVGNIAQPRIPSGLERLVALLVERYGLDDQDSVTVALDHFFSFRRNNLALQEYVNEFTGRYDEAESAAGLQINQVGLSHLLLNNSGLSDKAKDDLKMRLDGDTSRYTELKKLILRMARAPEREKQAYHGGHSDSTNWWETGEGDPWSDPSQSYWIQDDWYPPDDPSYYYGEDYDYDYYDESWPNDSYYGDDYDDKSWHGDGDYDHDTDDLPLLLPLPL